MNPEEELKVNDTGAGNAKINRGSRADGSQERGNPKRQVARREARDKIWLINLQKELSECIGLS